MWWREEASSGEASDKHCCGRTKSHLILREKNRRRRGAVVSERIRDQPKLQLRGACVCCSAKTWLLGADVDYKLLL